MLLILKCALQENATKINVDYKNIEKDISTQNTLQFCIFGLIGLLVLLMIILACFLNDENQQLDQMVKVLLTFVISVAIGSVITITVLTINSSLKNEKDNIQLQKDLDALTHKAQVLINRNSQELNQMLNLYSPITTDLVSEVDVLFFTTLLNNLYKLFSEFKEADPNLRLNSLLEFANLIKEMRGYMINFDYQSFVNLMPTFKSYIDSTTVDLSNFKIMIDQIYLKSVAVTNDSNINIKTLYEVNNSINFLNQIIPLFKSSINNKILSFDDIASSFTLIANRFEQNLPNFGNIELFAQYISDNLISNTAQQNFLVSCYQKIISGPATMLDIQNLLLNLQSKLISFGFNFNKNGTGLDVVAFLNNMNSTITANAQLLNELLLNLETNNILNLRDIFQSSVLMFRNLRFLGVLDPNNTSTVLLNKFLTSYNIQLSKFTTMQSAILTFDPVKNSNSLEDKNTNIYNLYLSALTSLKTAGIINPSIEKLNTLMNNIINNTISNLYDFRIYSLQNMSVFLGYLDSLIPNAYITPLIGYGASNLSDVQQFVSNIVSSTSSAVTSDSGLGIVFSFPALKTYSKNIFEYLNFLTNFFNLNLDFFYNSLPNFINSVPNISSITPSANWNTLYNNIVVSFNNKKSNGGYGVDLTTYNLSTNGPIFNFIRENLFNFGQDASKSVILTQKIDTYEKEIYLNNNTNCYISDYPLNIFNLYCLVNFPTLDPANNLNVSGTLTGNLKQSLSFYLFFSSWYRHPVLDYSINPNILSNIIYTIPVLA